MRGELSLGYAHMVMDQWMVGGRIGMDAYVNWSPDRGERDTGIDILPHLFVRHYFSQGKWTPFLEVGGGLDVDLVWRGWGEHYQELRPGMLFHINEHLSLEFANIFTVLTARFPTLPNEEQSVYRYFSLFKPILGLNVRLK